MPQHKVYVAKYRPGISLPRFEGKRNILIHTSDKNLGGKLSPYHLTVRRKMNDEYHDVIIENHWQFSKRYPRVEAIRTPLGRYHPNTIIWEHPAEDHVENGDPVEDGHTEGEDPADAEGGGVKDGNDVTEGGGQPNDNYWDWRVKGMMNPYAVRYPNGFRGKQNCIDVLVPIDNETEDGSCEEGYNSLDYIEARKRVYCQDYAEAVEGHPEFAKLQKLLKTTDIIIYEVDGPDYTLSYEPYTHLSQAQPYLEMNEKVIRMLVNDPRKPFGHGYTIAALLLGGAEWMS